MAAVALLLLFFGTGVFLRQKIRRERAFSLSHNLTRYVIYIALPALILHQMPRLHPDSSLLLPILSAWGIFLFSVGVLLLAARYWGWSRSLLGGLLLSVPLGNTSFMGIPFTQAFFGEAGIPYALIYDQLGSFLILSTAGIVILALFRGENPSGRKILLSILRFPAFVALALSLMLPATFLEWLDPLSAALASTLSPVALVAVGLQLQLRFEAEHRSALIFGLLLKLILAPLLLLWIFRLVGIEGIAAQVSVFEAAMAPMISSSSMAILAGLESRFVATLLGYGILASFLTLPLIAQIVQSLL